MCPCDLLLNSCHDLHLFDFLDDDLRENLVDLPPTPNLNVVLVRMIDLDFLGVFVAVVLASRRVEVVGSTVSFSQLSRATKS